MKTSEAERKELYALVGQALKRLRRDRKLTQQALADKVQLSRTSVTNIEKGRQKLLVHTIADLARALEAPIGDLIPLTSRETSSTVDGKTSHLSPKDEKFVKLVMRARAAKGNSQ